MQPEDLIVEVRDRTLHRVGIVLPDDLECEVYPLHNGIGSWTLTLPREHPLASALRQPGSGLIVSTKDGVILSGPTTSPELTTSTSDPTGTVVFNGVGDTQILADMLGWPDPANLIGAQDELQDERTGPAETLMHQYVSANVGPDAIASRRNIHLDMGENGQRGDILTKQVRFAYLGDVCTDLAVPYNLGYRVIQRGDRLVFETYQVADRSREVRLTLSNGALSEAKVTTAAPAATRALVAGPGDESLRAFTEVSTEDSVAAEAAWGRRIEIIVDNPDSYDSDVLAQAGITALIEQGGEALAVEATPSDNTSQVFGRDWFLGDKVTVEVDGVEVGLVAAGAAIKAAPEGTSFGVAFGDMIAIDSASARTLAGVETRVSSLETNVNAAVPPPWITLPSSITGSWGVRYIYWQGKVFMHVDGSIAALAAGASRTISTTSLPAELWPPANASTGAYASARSAIGRVLTDGSVQLINTSASSASNCSFLIEYVPVGP